ncbi:LysR substrate-binding domain-containing protein [Kiloniella sp. b19]|uniref:LysR substrate-binding domain-containing protein n=1 Tax=Kiloniella sp. GXU_MW_B19 TaxID=3141326 RepID=UPI0031D09AFB
MKNTPELRNRLLQNASLLHAILQEGSFSGAGLLNGLEQSAVSHRIKSLEKALGVRLFERTTRRIVPTEAGRIVCEAAGKCSEICSDTLIRIGETRTSGTIRLSVSSSLAMKWVLPALPRIQQSGLDLVVDTNEKLSDLHNGEAQVALRYGPGPYPGLHAEALLQARLVPVARPGLLPSGALSPEQPGKDIRLLSDRHGESDTTGFSWSEYFEKRGWQKAQKTALLPFERTDLSLQAAISGLGVALGRTLLVENDLEAGFLVAVGEPVLSPAKYWLVTTPAYAGTEGYKRLGNWIRDEIKQVREQHKRLFPK